MDGLAINQASVNFADKRVPCGFVSEQCHNFL